MDEILIEEKRYISSKRAAKVTGYAKDYIGQLCREGRVPARLVGRNWYVLETAIHDHRFSRQDGVSEYAARTTPDAASTTPQSIWTTWEFPHYESSQTETLPPINRIQDTSTTRANEQQNLQDSWREWFDRVTDVATSAIPDVISEKATENAEKREEREVMPDEKEVRIPIRAIHHHQRYQAPPEELLPRRRKAEERSVGDVVEKLSVTAEKRKIGRSAMAAIRIVGVLFAVLSVIFAVVGSGYFDTYIITSYSQASVLTGISVHNK